MKPRLLDIRDRTRHGHRGETVAIRPVRQLERRGATKFEMIDQRDHPPPFVESSAPRASGRDKRPVPRWAGFAGRVQTYVFVNIEYIRGYHPVPESAVNRTTNRKPITPVNYGAVTPDFRAAAPPRYMVVGLPTALIPQRALVASPWGTPREAGKPRQAGAAWAVCAMPQSPHCGCESRRRRGLPRAVTSARASGCGR